MPPAIIITEQQRIFQNILERKIVMKYHPISTVIFVWSGDWSVVSVFPAISINVSYFRKYIFFQYF